MTFRQCNRNSVGTAFYHTNKCFFRLDSTSTVIAQFTLTVSDISKLLQIQPNLRARLNITRIAFSFLSFVLTIYKATIPLKIFFKKHKFVSESDLY